MNAAFDNQISTRLDDKQTGKILVVAQRLHENDLPGHVLSRGDWDYVKLPAIAEEDTVYRLSNEPNDVYRRRAGEPLHAARDPLWILEEERIAQGSYAFEAQYQQNPSPPAGNLIRRDWLRWFDDTAPLEDYTLVITSWDFASTQGETSDYSVGTAWGLFGSEFRLLDVVRGRWEYMDLRQKVINLDRNYSPSVNVIEDTEFGRAIQQDLRRTTEIRLSLYTPRFDKVSRLLSQTPHFEAGRVFLPRDQSFLGAYEAELTSFPNGRHDDQVDSTSQALYYLSARYARLRPTRDPRRDRVRRDPVRR